jgi:hypothetical protein
MVTLRFSSSLYVTSDSFFHELISMHTSISQLCKIRDAFLGDMEKNIWWKSIKKYWGDQDKQDFLLYVVIVLDLCFKLKYVRFYF